MTRLLLLGVIVLASCTAPVVLSPTTSSNTEVRPDLVREARIHWGVENNIYQLWHRGYVAVKGGAMDCPYTFMQDMVAGTFRLPWEDQVKVTDGTSCGFPMPTRLFGPKSAKAAE